MTLSATRTEYAVLGDRMRYLLGLRVAIAATTAAWSLIQPRGLGIPIGTVLAAAAAYVAIAVALEVTARRWTRLALPVLTTLLLVDGVYLAFANYATGGTQSPMRFLIYLHLVAVSLLASYRTGLKIALWHSLLLFVVLYAQAGQLLPPVDVAPGRGVEFDRMPVLNVTAFWLFALATSIFSAMNERELRQRRADLQALVDVGSRLDDAGDPVHQSAILLDGLAEQFGFERGVVLGASDGRMLTLASRGIAAPTTAAQDPDWIVERAWTARAPLAVKRLDATRDAFLSAILPDARNLLVAPMLADGRPLGAVVVEHRGRRLFGVERRVVSIVGQFASIGALNLRNAVLLKHVRDLAERDALTGAANRRTFEMSLGRVLGDRRGVDDDVSAVLFVDLDDFKVVNDTLGHSAGDALLVAVTERIAGLVREDDLVARLGGDEFAILTTDAPDLHRCRAMAERLVRELRAPYAIGEHHLTVTASIGIASARDALDGASDLVRNADVAMYMAKANGKAGFAVFDPGMHAAIRDRHELAVDLTRAVELDQLRLVYQPIIELETGRLAGVEALVRWQHPKRGLIPPVQFIEIAEENGSILPIGAWVLREACRQVGAWRREGRTSDDMFVCVNVSAREVQEPGFAERVQGTLRETGVDPHRLILEITETALLKATPSTVATLEVLRALAVRIVIDDFGTGYFSLSHLRQFPVDALKIAGEFVQGEDDGSRSTALAGAIVALAGSLGIETVAEGIETNGQADRMRTLNCRYGQGYFFARPLAATALDVERIEAAGGPVHPVAGADGLGGLDDGERPRPKLTVVGAAVA